MDNSVTAVSAPGAGRPTAMPAAGQPAVRTVALEAAPCLPGSPFITDELVAHRPSCTPSAARRRFLDGDTWVRHVGVKDGIELHRRTVATFPLPEFMASGIVEAPVDLVLATIFDLEASKQWLDCRDVGSIATYSDRALGATGLWFIRLKMPLILDDRLAVNKTTVRLHPETREVELVCESLPPDAEALRAAVEHAKAAGAEVDLSRLQANETHTHRIARMRVCMHMTALDGGRTDVMARVLLDPEVPGLSGLPGRMTYGKVKAAAAEQISSLRQRVQHKQLFSEALQRVHELADWRCFVPC